MAAKRNRRSNRTLTPADPPADVRSDGPGHAQKREAEFLPEIQLTLISVIKGAALAFLAAGIKSSIDGARLVTDWLPITVTFLVICAFWFSYLVGVTYLPWKLSLRDTMLFFALGLVENMMVQFISNRDWWLVFAGTFGLISGLAYLNDAGQLLPNEYSTRERFLQDRRGRLIRSAVSIAMGVAHFAFLIFGPPSLLIICVIDITAIISVLYMLKRNAERYQERTRG
jgi:hypothetical protein